MDSGESNIDISIVIPTYNERQGILELISELNAVTKILKRRVEYIFIDDGSTDHTFEEIKAHHKPTIASLQAIRLRNNCGKSTALAVGFRRARGSVIVTLDADLQDHPSEIPKLLKKIHEGWDLVAGWRVDRKDSSEKVLLSRIFNAVVSKVSGIPIHDFNIGLKAYKRSVTEEITLYGELHRYIPLLAAARGFRITEVPVTHYRRKYGASKFGFMRIFRSGFDLLSTLFLISFRRQPLQLFGTSGALFFGLGTAVLIYLSYLHFIGQSIGRRPLLFLGVLLVISGFQLFSTGLLAELMTSYLERKEQHPIETEISA